MDDLMIRKSGINIYSHDIGSLEHNHSSNSSSWTISLSGNLIGIIRARCINAKMIVDAKVMRRVVE